MGWGNQSTGVPRAWCSTNSSRMMASTREVPCARMISPSVAFCSGMMNFCAVPAHLAALAVACGSPPAPANLAACAARPCMAPHPLLY